MQINKIKTIIYSILIILTIISSIFVQGKTNPSNFFIQTEEMSNAPNWKINDSWTYHANIDTKINDSQLNLSCEELTVKIQDVQEDTYKMYFSGAVEGNGITEKYGDIEQFAGTIDGFIYLGENFSLKHINDTIIQGDALVRDNSFPIIVHMVFIISNLTFKPEANIFSFPIFVGKNWSTPITDVEMHGNLIVGVEHKEIDIVQPSAFLPGLFKCTNIENFYLEKYGISIPAYNVSEEYCNKINIKYSSNISSIVSGSFNDLEMGNISISADFYLKNSSYIKEATELSIFIKKPSEKTFYLWNNSIELFSPVTTIIIGETEVKCDLEGGLGNINVSLYLDDKIIKTLAEPPYKFILDEEIFSLQKHKIRVVATDNLSRVAEDHIYAKIINLGIN
jgi:hypothetical protein